MITNLAMSGRAAPAGRWIAACAITVWAGCAQAQDYPTREIRLVNGYAAGAGADIASRIFGKHLEERFGKPVIVENKPGAFTNIGAATVARAQPDGYSLMFSGHTAIATNIHLFKTLPFDPVKDFVAIAPAGRISFGFGVPPNSPVKSIAELTAHLKAKGEKATYGYANTFGLTATELYKNVSGVPALAVPYKSAGDALNELSRGDIDLLVYDLGTLTQQEQGGRLRVIAVTTAERSSLRPDVPGMREAGLPDYDLGAWFGIWGPANVPTPIVDRLAGAISEIWDKEDKRKGLTAQTIEPFKASPAEFAKFVTNETNKWGRVIEIAKIEKQ
jgi:tripartite-type tricarboxylate transporter receptor subunit TctC